MTLCPGCARPPSPAEILTGRCGKDGQPITAPRSTVHIPGSALQKETS